MEKDKLGGAQLIAVGKAAETAETEGLKLAKSGSGGKVRRRPLTQQWLRGKEPTRLAGHDPS